MSVEAAKWAWALEQLGFDVRTVAGAGVADVVVPSLAIDADERVEPGDVEAALGDADLVVVDNLCSLPLNPEAAAAVAATLRGRRAVFRHHDLPWQRARFADHPPPPDDLAWIHVTVNDLSRMQLAERGIDAVTVRNTFDPDPPPGDRAATRAHHRVGADRLLVVQPTRAIARKGVPLGVALAERLDAALYWLVGPTEEDYHDGLASVLGRARVRVARGLPRGFDIADAYAAADVVAFPSEWEGFGNPVIESALYRRPLALRRYPVAVELERFGFRWFDIDDLSVARADPELLEHNRAVARRHFSLHDLPERIEGILRGWL